MSEDSQNLAIDGGRPVREQMLPYGRHSITEDDIAAVVAVLQSDWLTAGPRVEQFEGALAETVGATHAVCFSSGTAALHAAVSAAGLGPGDEAITTSLTFCATANCLVYEGATPVFADICPDTLTLDPQLAARRVTSRTKALLPVDYAGQPAELDALMDIAERHHLVIIEDAAHAIGATYRGRRIGSISHMTAFSFHAVKHITTGEGGAITTNNPELAKRLRLFRSHGIETTPRQRQASWQPYYEMTALGYNYRLTDIGCALGLSQLSRLSSNVERRRTIAARYTDGLSGVPLMRLPVTAAKVDPSWHLYPVRVPAPIRDDVGRGLRGERIGVAQHYPPLHLHPYYRDRFGFRSGDYPTTERASAELLSLPMFHSMTDSDIDSVIDAVWKVMKRHAA